MKLFIPMVKSSGITLFILSTALSLVCLLGCGTETQTVSKAGFNGLPIYVDEHRFSDNSGPLIPWRIHRYFDTLFIAFKDRPFIDKFSMELKQIGRIRLEEPEPVSPNEFYVTDSFIVVLSHRREMVILYDHDGGLVKSFGTQPDGLTPLLPFSVYCYGGVAYVGDITMHGVMAISITNADQITEVGELILSIPSDTTHQIGFPGALIVTVDGRLIAADATDGMIKVFTCDGRYVYNFDSLPPLERSPAIHAFVYDDVPDPSLLDTTKFDPSNIATHGRLHAVDAVNHQIHMFNTLGKYVASYPSDSTILTRPVDIALDYRANLIYVVDPEKEAVILFEYKE